MQKSQPFLFFLLTGLLIMAGAYLFNRSSNSSLEQMAATASKKMAAKLLHSKEAIEWIDNFDEQGHIEAMNELFEKEEISLYKYQNDSLIFWNNSQTPLELNLKLLQKKQGLLKLKHGYYLFYQKQHENQRRIALCSVKPLYEIQNRYLKNRFSEWTDIHDGVEISEDSTKGTPVLLEGQNLFYIIGNDRTYSSQSNSDYSFSFFLMGILLVLIALLRIIQSGISDSKFAITILIVIGLRLVQIFFKWPSFFYASTLFDLREFGNAQSFLNGYLGDLILNAILCLFLAAAIRWQVLNKNNKINNKIFIGLIILILWFVYHQIQETLISLVSNSTLSFEFLNIFNVRPLAFVGMSSICFYALSLFLLLNLLLYVLEMEGLKLGLWFIVIILLISFFNQMLFSSSSFKEAFWLLPVSIILLALRALNIHMVSYRLGLYILFMSVWASYMFDKYMKENLKAEFNILSARLSERQDATLENEYSRLPSKIEKDEQLNTLIGFLPNTQKEIALLLKQKYFGSYFDRFDLKFSLFDNNCMPLLPMTEAVYMTQGYFEEQIYYGSDSTFVKNLFFVKAHKQNTRYLAKIKLNNNTLFIIMDAKKVEELGSFPDLLLDQSQQKQDKLGRLSYGVYRSGLIVNQFGEFNYPYFLIDSSVISTPGSRYKHNYFQAGEGATVIISEREKSFTDKFTFNSYVFLYFSLIGFIGYYIYTIVFSSIKRASSLTQRIQGIIILLLLFAMSAVGITSSRLVTKQFRNENKKQLNEKTLVIINELLGEFSAQNLFDVSQKELVNQKLIDYARFFKSDVSLFDARGFLINTSQPKLYELGLAAGIVNPMAFYELRTNKASSSAVVEKAGTLSYLSQYTPLFNSQKELVGFINLPYFARENDLTNELSSIISALINVYVILFILSIVAGLTLSGYITKPLRLIKQQISEIALGRRNESISWQSDDEIGRLISEYNQMLIKLEQSANRLAQSERESAWREMAKQVAHEIKNPLTPMKLNIQYLQHLMRNNPDDFKDKFEKASVGIIEQIDSLANIATEFSVLAKLPGTQLHSINLVEIIQNSTQLFNNDNRVLFVNEITGSEIIVKGDKDQCLRVFNNLIKNALQALEEIENPRIIISCQLNAGIATISISDNGCGISEALKPILFTPNFTTKTAGSGLGLAMVKNIMQGFGGKIWFESTEGKGAVFFLEFILL